MQYQCDGAGDVLLQTDTCHGDKGAFDAVFGVGGPRDHRTQRISRCLWNCCFVTGWNDSCSTSACDDDRKLISVEEITALLHLWFFFLPAGRKREWFKIEDAIKVLQYHKPVQASYFETLRQGCLANNGTPVMTTTYSESSVSDIRWLKTSLGEQFWKPDWNMDFPPPSPFSHASSIKQGMGSSLWQSKC